MADSPPVSAWRSRLVYGLTILGTAAVAVLVTALLMNIHERQEEGKQHYLKLVELDESTVDPAVWGRNFPRQYDSYKRTVDQERTRHGGNDALDTTDKLERDPFLKLMYAGYAFSIDYRDLRGHAYMLQDQRDTRRVKERKQPGACLHCHAAVMPAYRELGGGDDWEHVKAGFEKMCGMEYPEAVGHVSHPVTCLDCHEPKTAQLRVNRPAFLIGIQALAQGEAPVPHLPSVERWRKGNRKVPYDPNTDATRQELRSLVCAQCHVEYHFTPKTSVLAYPWANGLKADQAEKYYDDIGFKDWTHAETGAPMLKAQHPEFEMWSQGIHARSGVSCADCHMPYKREGAVKVSDHHVRSPMLNASRACQVCHRYPEEELQARVATIQARTESLHDRARAGVKDLIEALQAARQSKTDEKALAAARALHRKAQWRLDYVFAENSRGFHASQETARILGEAADLARQGQIVLLKRE
jgi:nitrite reductase (cytochrome c-552)